MADLLDLLLDGDGGGCDAIVPVAAAQQGSQSSGHGSLLPTAVHGARSFQGTSMKGKVGRGRFGNADNRSLLALHMRSQKRARCDHSRMQNVLTVLRGSTFKKGCRKFKIGAKETRRSGVIISIQQQGTRGNRFSRKIPFNNFLEASYGKNGTNVAVAARLDMDISTVPKVQKTCSAVAMSQQAKLLWMLLRHCHERKPLSIMRPASVFVCLCVCL